MEYFNVANFESVEPNLTSVYPEKVTEPENSLLYSHLANHGINEVDVPQYQQEVRQRLVRGPSMPPMMFSPGPEPFMHTFVSLIHTILAIFALYLSFICNKGFDLPSFMGAACCPYIYILYVFAIRPDLCGLRT